MFKGDYFVGWFSLKLKIDERRFEWAIRSDEVENLPVRLKIQLDEKLVREHRLFNTSWESRSTLLHTYVLLHITFAIQLSQLEWLESPSSSSLCELACCTGVLKQHSHSFHFDSFHFVVLIFYIEFLSCSTHLNPFPLQPIREWRRKSLFTMDKHEESHLAVQRKLAHTISSVHHFRNVFFSFIHFVSQWNRKKDAVLLSEWIYILMEAKTVNLKSIWIG